MKPIQNSVWKFFFISLITEKFSVLEMIRTVLSNKENYYSHDVPTDYVEHKAGDLMGTPDPMGVSKSDVLGINHHDKMEK